MTLPTPKTAIYTTNLPSNGKKISFRPWTIAEEKTLLIAKDDDHPETARLTLYSVLSQCIKDKIIVEELPDLDIDWLLFQLSSRSDGEITTLVSKCGFCQNEIDFICDKIKDISIQGNLEKLKNNRVEIVDGIFFELTLPTRKDIDDLQNDDLTIEQIIVRCLKTVYTEDDQFSSKDYTEKELFDYIQNEFNKNDLRRVYDFYKDFPKVVLSHSTECKHCKNDNTLRIEGFTDFFL